MPAIEPWSIGMLCIEPWFMPGIAPWSIPGMDPWSMFIPDIEPCCMPPMPISAMVRIGRGSSGGIAAAMPGRGASVPRANPVRSSAWAKIV